MNEQFAYKEIRWVCTCGLPRLFVRTGVSSRGELTAQWNCRGCGKNVMATMKLEDVVAAIPQFPQSGPLRPPLQIAAPDFTSLDVEWAKLMHLDLGGNGAT